MMKKKLREHKELLLAEKIKLDQANAKLKIEQKKLKK
jgi:hypothetical protein